MKKILYFIFGTVFLASCGSKAPKEEPQKKETLNQEISLCTYTYNREATSVFWKAYKHTAKVGVNGRFETFDVNGAKPGSSPEKLLLGLKMSVDVSSVNSNDTLRDGKLRRSFFGKMMNTSMITGEIVAVNGTTGKIKMKMNDIEQDVPFDLSIHEEEVEVRATIDILNFAANEAFETLGNDCAEKHTGGDGVKKFWSEVDIYIKTTLNKECIE